MLLGITQAAVSGSVSALGSGPIVEAEEQQQGAKIRNDFQNRECCISRIRQVPSGCWACCKALGPVRTGTDRDRLR